jgi:hypothetical protein
MMGRILSVTPSADEEMEHEASTFLYVTPFPSFLFFISCDFFVRYLQLDEFTSKGTKNIFFPTILRASF